MEDEEKDVLRNRDPKVSESSRKKKKRRCKVGRLVTGRKRYEEN